MFLGKDNNKKTDVREGDIELGLSTPLLEEDTVLVAVEPEKVEQKELSAVEVYTRLANYLLHKENLPNIAGAAGLTGLGIAFNFLAPYLFTATTEALQSKQSVEIVGIEVSPTVLVVSLVGAMGLSQLIPNIRDTVLAPVPHRSIKKILMDLSRYMLNKSMDYHRNTENGEKTFLIGKGFTVADNANALLTSIIPTLFEISLAVVVLSTRYNLQLGVGLLAVLTLYTAYSYLAGPRILHINELRQKKGAEAWGQITKVPAQYKLIWDFNHPEYTLSKIEQIIQEIAQIAIDAERTSLKVNQVQIIISRFGMLLAALYMTQRILANQNTVGDFITLMTYLNQLANALPAFGQAINNILASYPALELVFKALAEPSEVIDLYPDVPLIIEQLPTIEFRNVTFGYPVRYSPCLMSSENFLESGKFHTIAIYKGDSEQLSYSLRVNGEIIHGHFNEQDLPDHYVTLCEKVRLQALDPNQSLNEEEKKAILNVALIKKQMAQEPVTLLLKDMSFTIQSGQMTVLVSESGAGKSSIFDLLYRYYDPLSGDIFINGQNIKEVSLQSLRDQITLFRQKTDLLNDTIRANIQYGAKNPDTVTDVQIMAVAKRMKLEKFIDKLGLDTVIGDTLSGGEQQKISILRGLLKEGSICLFDEITASLDAQASEDTTTGIKTTVATRLIITHKLAEVTPNADSIIVIDKKTGTIAAQGSHEELLNPESGCKIYRDLWIKQNAEYSPERSSSPIAQPSVYRSDKHSTKINPSSLFSQRRNTYSAKSEAIPEKNIVSTVASTKFSKSE